MQLYVNQAFHTLHTDSSQSGGHCVALKVVWLHLERMSVSTTALAYVSSIPGPTTVKQQDYDYGTTVTNQTTVATVTELVSPLLLLPQTAHSLPLLHKLHCYHCLNDP